MQNTLLEILRRSTLVHPEKVLYSFLSADLTLSSQFTYQGLLKKSESLAALIQQHTQQNERVLILLSDREEFIIALFATLLCGNIAVPAHPPKRNKVDQKSLGIIQDCDPSIVISNQKIHKRSKEYNPHLAALTWLCIDDEPSISNKFHSVEVSPSQTAIIQYTSGSTGTPKGVVLSHSNISANSEVIQGGMKLNQDSKHVSWLPQFHDMGLFGSILGPVFYNVEALFISPQEFVQKPIRWLKAISDHKASISGAPNFGYELCIEKIKDEDCKGLDLSHWKVAYCGSEMINPDTLKRFGKKFSAYGFDAKAFYPCYGMAEATLMISGGAYFSGFQSSSLPKNRISSTINTGHYVKEVVDCGQTAMNATVKIMTEGKVCEEGEIGEIFYKGPNVAQGYWQRPSDSESVFNIKIGNQEGFLKTGDLGFLIEGSLFVTGREKDLVIKHGQNFYTSDIQSVASRSHESLIKDGAFAFSIQSNNGELLIIIQEVKRTALKGLDSQSIIEAISSQVTEYLEIQSETIILVSEKALPRTPSGKLMREQAILLYTQKSKTNILHRWDWEHGTIPDQELKSTPTEEDVQLLLQRLFLEFIPTGNEPPMPDDCVFELGIDSISAVDLTVTMEKSLGISLDPSLLWEFQTIREIANFIHTQKAN
ncbi:MAG: acyl-CoA synthetase (AMP-forming)/AMP-acid ligase II/acyl carrier protein [Candidatus Endobugula sp.]|jgi:acyl-CoA synthetase (AMP-forming)/AMP-acid ligase II/acyl carrier protein